MSITWLFVISCDKEAKHEQFRECKCFYLWKSQRYEIERNGYLSLKNGLEKKSVRKWREKVCKMKKSWFWPHNYGFLKIPFPKTSRLFWCWILVVVLLVLSLFLSSSSSFFLLFWVGTSGVAFDCRFKHCDFLENWK